ncbi:unnamed protein product [Sphenostylis stenocarpa]|uniref:Uncharacterized protein n=1 Tax=Sphenostylis stenocarpa TaxID=92480 RepID=A0AA86VCQ7_9FABA|nr:unnamed protein product [Sphenostylis stenocarpa]
MRNRIVTLSIGNLSLHQRRFFDHFISNDLYHRPFSHPPKPYKVKKRKKNSRNGAPKITEAPTVPFQSNLPFDFRYSYSETHPFVEPISFRESTKFSPFGPGRLDRTWTGVSAPVRTEPDWKRMEEERNRVLGAPLNEDEVAELVERYRHSDCVRQINLGVVNILNYFQFFMRK